MLKINSGHDHQVEGIRLSHIPTHTFIPMTIKVKASILCRNSMPLITQQCIVGGLMGGRERFIY